MKTSRVGRKSGSRRSLKAQTGLLMALSCVFFLVPLLMPLSTAGHSMGEAVPITYVEGMESELIANVIAAYFGEQMGREIELDPAASVKICLDRMRSGRIPMAVLGGVPDRNIDTEFIIVDPSLVVREDVWALVMEEGAANQLQFSLIPMYMEKLVSVLSAQGWETGLARIRAGEGIRKVALDMLREKDLI